MTDTGPGGEHYGKFAIQPIDYIEANQLSFVEASIVKYVTRWREKGGVEDLKKARWYLERLINASVSTP
jgi:Protein of unknwon function (DUF3310)